MRHQRLCRQPPAGRGQRAIGAGQSQALARCGRVFSLVHQRIGGSQHLLAMEHARQPLLQLADRVGLDQVIVGREVGHRDHRAVARLAGHDKEGRAHRDQLVGAKLLEQMLAVVPAVEHKLAQDQVDRFVGPSQHVDRVRIAGGRGERLAAEADHQLAQHRAGGIMRIDDQDPVPDQRCSLHPVRGAGKRVGGGQGGGAQARNGDAPMLGTCPQGKGFDSAGSRPQFRRSVRGDRQWTARTRDQADSRWRTMCTCERRS